MRIPRNTLETIAARKTLVVGKVSHLLPLDRLAILRVTSLSSFFLHRELHGHKESRLSISSTVHYRFGRALTPDRHWCLRTLAKFAKDIPGLFAIFASLESGTDDRRTSLT